jgi:hypothetical protein
MPFEPLTPEEQKQYPQPCHSREHSPPVYMVLSPGTHKWVCPVCGKVTMITVPTITC